MHNPLNKTEPQINPTALYYNKLFVYLGSSDSRSRRKGPYTITR